MTIQVWLVFAFWHPTVPFWHPMQFGTLCHFGTLL